MGKAVLSGNTDTGATTSVEFAAVAKKQCPGIEVLHVSKDEVEKAKPKLMEELDNVRAIPDTKSKPSLCTIGRYCIDVMAHSRASATTRHVFKVVGNDNDNRSTDDVEAIDNGEPMEVDQQVDESENGDDNDIHEANPIAVEEAEQDHDDTIRDGHADNGKAEREIEIGNWVKVQYHSPP